MHAWPLITLAALFYLTKPSFFAFTGFSLLPTNITARKSLPARFDCQSTTGFVRWAAGNYQMISKSSCSGCELLLNGSLYFPSVTQAHAGHYICFIVGVLGPTPRYSVYLTLAG